MKIKYYINQLTGQKVDSTKTADNTVKKTPIIAHDYIFMIFCNALVSILSFTTTSLLLTYLGREKYGEIVSLTNFTLLLVILGGEWCSQAMIRYGTEEFIESGRIATVFWNRLYIVSACIILMICTSPLWSQILLKLFNFSLYGVIFILIYLPAQLYWNHIQKILPAIKHHRLRYPFLALERLVVLLALTILIIMNYLSVNSILPYYIMACLVASALSTFLIRHLIIPVQIPDLSVVKKIGKFSWPLIPTSLIGLLSTNTIDYLFISKYNNLNDLGVYALAIQISGLVQQVPLIAGDLTTPRFVQWRLKNQKTLFDHFISRQFPYMLWIWSAACLGGAIIVSSIGPHFIPDNYQLICELVWPMSIIASIVAIWYVIWNPLLTSHEQVRVVMWSSIATGIVNISMNFLLIPVFGIVGCAWATVAAYMTTCISAEIWCQVFQEKTMPARGLNLYLPTISMMTIVFIINSGIGS